MPVTTHDSLTDALAIRSRDFVALVGGGGKTGCLQLLSRELSARGHRVVATTTTAMFLKDLAAMGSVLVEPCWSVLRPQLETVLRDRRWVGAARDLSDDGKVAGLLVEWADELWATGQMEHLLVEADGSRGMSLKLFASHEPQVPSAATTIVQVAGLDVLGAPLTGSNVHRADQLATFLGVEPGTEVTAGMFVDTLCEQVRILHSRWPGTRIITLLNKAEGHLLEKTGLEIADELHARLRSKGGHAILEAVVVGSLKDRRFVRVAAPGVISAIVLAAGRSVRMGEQKVTLPLGGRSLVRRVVDAALGAAVAEVVVIVGHEAEAVRESLRDTPVRIVTNADYAQGMSTSLHAGIRAARPDSAAALFLLADQPFVTAAMIDLLISRFVTTGAWIVQPTIEGRPCHPVLVSANLFPEILGQQGDVGGREVLGRYHGKRELVPVDDVWTTVDIDTPLDYRAALRAFESQFPSPVANE